MWAALIPAIASLAGAGLNYMGGQQANAANINAAYGQMNFQQAQGTAQEIFSREMFDRQTGFNTDAASTAFNRQRELINWSNDVSRENRDYQAAYVDKSIRDQENFQREMAQQAQDFSLQSSATSWQRAVEDMKAAGINPMLAYQRGGASSPIGVGGSGASGSVAAPPGATGSAIAPTAQGGSRSAQSGAMARIENIVGPALGSAAQMGRLFGEVNNLNAQAENTKAQTALIGEQTHQTRAGTALSIANEANERERNPLIRQQVRNEQERLRLIGAQTGQSQAAAAASVATARQVNQQTDLTGLYGRQGSDPGSIVSQIEALGGGPGAASRLGSGVGNALQGILGQIGNLFR